MYIAHSRGSSSHSPEYGRRYFTLVWRYGETCSPKFAEPLGQSVPAFTGESGFPAMSMIRPSRW
jgi:hypothetical protein